MVYKKSSEHIYYNLRIDNAFDGFTNETLQQAVYDKQTGAILEKQSEYEVGVESWGVRAQLPIFIAPIKQGIFNPTNNINLMPFKVCYSFTTGGVTTDFSTELLWTPDPKFTDTPQAPPKPPSENNGLQDLFTNPGYYWCTKYQRFVDIINTALKSSYTDFNAAHGGIHAKECWLQYNAQTGLISMVAETSYATGANPANVFFDARLYKYIDTINAEFSQFSSLTGKDYRINFRLYEGESNGWAIGNHDAGVVPNPLTSPPAYIILEQETDSRFLWSNIKQILITSSSIAVRNTYMPFYSNPFQQQNRGYDQFNQNKKAVLSYVDYNYASPLQGASIMSSLSRDIYYKPKYIKWQELLSDSNLNNINVEIFYITDREQILPLNLPSDASASVNLVFRKKEE